ncbi:MAG: type II secretion system protein [Phycisphaerales bacterium]
MTRAARGFTLLETALATVIAGMLLIVVGGLFMSINVADRASSNALTRAAEFSMTQGTIRRAFLRLVMAADRELAEDEVLPRPRMLLEADGGAPGTTRFELVVSRPPVGANLSTTAAQWAFAASDESSLNYVSADGSGGQQRGVFELRRDGEREFIMASFGLESPWWEPPTAEQLAERRATRADIRPATYAPGQRPAIEPDAPGWTLWYRRMIPEEVALLEQGVLPWRDGEGDPEIEARRLAGAVRLATGLTEAQWRVYKGDAWVTQFEALMTRELPAFVQFRARAKNGTYGEWLFEVAWTEAENVGTDDEASFFGGGGGASGETGGADEGEQGEREEIPDPTRDPAANTDGGTTLPQADGDSASGGMSATIRGGSR